MSDVRDPRLALYCQKRFQDPAECREQERELAKRALGADPTLVEGEAGITVALHYSWECLRRLHQASRAGRKVFVQSVLVPSLAPDELLEAAVDVAPEVYAVEPQLFSSHFQPGGAAGLATLQCGFAVAFPVSRPLATLSPPFLVLDGLESPKSLGQVLHAAAGLGVESVVASPSTWAKLDGRAARSSLGSVYRLGFHRAEVAEALRGLRAAGVRAYVLEGSGTGVPVSAHEPLGDRNWALVVGGEDGGVSAGVRALSEARVCVPQRGGEALSPPAAAAICLYELGRRMDP